MAGKKTRPKREAIDLGTTELAHRHSVRPERSAGAVRLRVLDGNNIDKLLWMDALTPDEHSTLVGFQVDLHRASLLGLRAATLEAKVSGASHNLSNIEADHRLKCNQCLEFLQKNYGRQVMNIILDLCLDDKKPPDAHLWRDGIRGLVEFRELWIRTRPEPSAD